MTVESRGFLGVVHDSSVLEYENECPETAFFVVVEDPNSQHLTRRQVDVGAGVGDMKVEFKCNMCEVWEVKPYGRVTHAIKVAKGTKSNPTRNREDVESHVKYHVTLCFQVKLDDGKDAWCMTETRGARGGSRVTAEVGDETGPATLGTGARFFLEWPPK